MRRRSKKVLYSVGPAAYIPAPDALDGNERRGGTDEGPDARVAERLGPQAIRVINSGNGSVWEPGLQGPAAGVCGSVGRLGRGIFDIVIEV
jgi:hypothetical protein